MKIHFNCPHCHKELVAKSGEQEGKCPRCGAVIWIPTQSGMDAKLLQPGSSEAEIRKSRLLKDPYPFRFICPDCGFIFQIRDGLQGRKWTCHRCGAKLLVPSTSGKTADSV